MLAKCSRLERMRLPVPGGNAMLGADAGPVTGRRHLPGRSAGSAGEMVASSWDVSGHGRSLDQTVTVLVRLRRNRSVSTSQSRNVPDESGRERVPLGVARAARQTVAMASRVSGSSRSPPSPDRTKSAPCPPAAAKASAIRCRLTGRKRVCRSRSASRMCSSEPRRVRPGRKSRPKSRKTCVVR